MRRWAPFLIPFGIIVDQASKYWAQNTLSMYTATPILPPVLSFQLVHNYGAAYGIFQHQKVFLVSISLLVLLSLPFYKRFLPNTPLVRWGVCFLAIGAAGNLIDRIVHGYVIDFINIHIIPVFNIADICINITLACLIIDTIKHRHES